MRSPVTVGVPILLAVIQFFCRPSLVGALECYECSEADDPKACDTKVSCYAGQECMVSEKIARAGARYVYDLKCQWTSVCKIISDEVQAVGRREPGKSALPEESRSGQLSKRKDFCYACCNESLCNRHLCSAGWTKPSQTPTSEVTLLLAPSGSTVMPEIYSSSPSTSQTILSTDETSLVPIIRPESMVVRLGTAFVEFKCKVSGNPHYRWFHRGSEDSHVPWTLGLSLDDQAVSVVRITSPTYRMAGTFTCRAQLGNFVLDQEANLTVIVSVELPEIIQGPPNITARVGDAVVMTCQTIGLPVPIVSWFFQDVEGFPTLPIGATRNKNNSLVFPSVSAANAGKYTCVARVHDVMVQESGYLVVE